MNKRAGGAGFAVLLGALLLLPGLISLPAYRVDLDAVLRPPSLAHPWGRTRTGATPWPAC